MNKNKGTIYLRDTEWYRAKNVIKMGITSNPKDRSSNYITGEVERGEYILVVEIPLEKMKPIDDLLKYKFRNYHIYYGGGTEFYDRSIYNLVVPYLQTLNIEYKVLSKEEIDIMERCARIKNMKKIDQIKKIINQINFASFIEKLKYNKQMKNKIIAIQQKQDILDKIIPNQQQQDILNKIKKLYKNNDILKIVWACGLGKALLSILIVKIMNFKSVVLGVPSNYLQNQIKNEILKIFPNKSNILFVGGDGKDGIKTTTKKKDIKSFMQKNNENNECKFIITTYHSCYLLVNNSFTFDYKIGDEAHHLVGLEKEDEKGFRLFHKIKSSKTLFMTATEKTIDTKTDKEKYSMDDENIFGKYIDVKSVCWAIENKKITDYNILILKNTQDQVNEIINRLGISPSNKELFISGYMCLKSFEKYNDLTHLLLYTNTTDDAELVNNYINEILELNILSIKKEDIYNNALHSKNCDSLETEVNNFKNATC